MTQAIAALGVLLKRNGNTIAELSKIGPVGKSRETLDCTNLNTTGGYKEFIGGMRDGGVVAIEGNFVAGDTNGQIGLQTDFDGETAQSFVVVFPTAVTATWTFTGVVTKFETSFEVNNKVPFSSEIKITGQPVLAVTASTGLTTPFFVCTGGTPTYAPAAAGTEGTYVINVVTGTTSVTLTPTAAAGVITVAGNIVATGVASGAIALGAAGSITSVAVTVTETGKVAKNYTILIVRAAA
jgi:predicted secreted protein